MPENSTREKELQKGFKATVLIGTVLGIFSRNDLLLNTKTQQSSQRVRFLLRAYSGSLFTFFAVSSILTIRQYVQDFNKNGQNFMEKIGAFTHVAYGCSITFVYGYHLFIASTRLRTIFANFCDVTRQLNPVDSIRPPRKRSSFPIFCWVLTLSVLTLGIIENVWFDVETIKKKIKFDSEVDWLTKLCGYYCTKFGDWHDLIPLPYGVLIIILIILPKIATWGWIFADTIVIVLCQALAMQFTCLDEVIHNDLVKNPMCKIHGFEKLNSSSTKIAAVVKVEPYQIKANEEDLKCHGHDHNPRLTTGDISLERFWLLVKLTAETERYVGPLILTCFICVSHILVIFFAWISPDIPVSLSTSHSNHIYYSSMYYCLRVGVMTYYVSKVHQASQKILVTVQSCSNSAYLKSAERLERKLIGSPVGIRIFGTFLITRHFFVSIISFIFTTEIVLLQMASALRSQSQQ